MFHASADVNEGQPDDEADNGEDEGEDGVKYDAEDGAEEDDAEDNVEDNVEDDAEDDAEDEGEEPESDDSIFDKPQAAAKILINEVNSSFLSDWLHADDPYVAVA